jgi:hypothetical protein
MQLFSKPANVQNKQARIVKIEVRAEGHGHPFIFTAVPLH